MTTVSASPSQAQESTRLIDGFHLVVDALKANDVDTIYGVVGIPITDLARVRRRRNPLHRFPAGDLGRQRRGIAGFLTRGQACA